MSARDRLAQIVDRIKNEDTFEDTDVYVDEILAAGVLSDYAKAVIATLVADRDDLEPKNDNVCASVEVWQEVREAFPLELVPRYVDADEYDSWTTEPKAPYRLETDDWD